jgi:hypothetical protein
VSGRSGQRSSAKSMMALDPCTTWPSHIKIGTEVALPSRRVTAR